MTMTLNEAAKSCGKAKGTILKAIKEGRLSAPKDGKGRYEIDPSELYRVFPVTGHSPFSEPLRPPNESQENYVEIAQLRAELKSVNAISDVMAETVTDLRERLDREGAERRQLMALLTDERTGPQKRRRKFWPF